MCMQAYFLWHGPQMPGPLLFHFFNIMSTHYAMLFTRVTTFTFYTLVTIQIIKDNKHGLQIGLDKKVYQRVY